MAASPVARSVIAGRAPPGCSALKRQGNWADLRGSNESLLFPGFTNRSQMDAFGLFTGQVGWAWNNTLLYVKGGAAVTDTRHDIITDATGAVFGIPAMTPDGARSWRRHRIRLCSELVGWR